jgi:hypothetical protein
MTYKSCFLGCDLKETTFKSRYLNWGINGQLIHDTDNFDSFIIRINVSAFLPPRKNLIPVTGFGSELDVRNGTILTFFNNSYFK